VPVPRNVSRACTLCQQPPHLPRLGQSDPAGTVPLQRINHHRLAPLHTSLFTTSVLKCLFHQAASLTRCIPNFNSTNSTIPSAATPFLSSSLNQAVGLRYLGCSGCRVPRIIIHIPVRCRSPSANVSIMVVRARWRVPEKGRLPRMPPARVKHDASDVCHFLVLCRPSLPSLSIDNPPVLKGAL